MTGKFQKMDSGGGGLNGIIVEICTLMQSQK